MKAKGDSQASSPLQNVDSRGESAKQALQCACVGTWDFDVQSGEATFNQDWYRMLGYAPEEVQSSIDAWRGLVHADDLSSFNEQLSRHLAGETERFQIQARFQHKDRTWVLLQTTGQVYQRNPEGVAERLAGVQLPLSAERKGAPATEADSERHLTLLELMEKISSIGAWDLDLVHNTLYWSEGIYRIHEREIEKGMPELEEAINYYDEEFREELGGFVKRAAEEGVPFNFELPIVTEKGNRRWVRSIGMPFRNEAGEIVRLAGSFQDITEKRERSEKLRASLEELQCAKSKLESQSKELVKQRDKANQASEAKSLFLANMSHEIRTPIYGVLGMLDLLRDTELSTSQSQFVEDAKSSASFLVSIIGEILDFSRVEAGKIELAVDFFSLHDLISNLQSMFEYQCRQEELVLVFDIDKKLPAFVKGDRNRISQVLINLIGNALKFSQPHGAIFIAIHQIQRRGENVEVLFNVSDTGIGIPQEQQQNIFDSFWQADASTTRKFGGTGLGLAISSRLVSLMNSKIQLASKPGIGSRFWFTVTTEHREQIEEGPISDTKLEDTTAQGLRILVAEDNAVNQRIAAHFLQSAGHHVVVVENGADAVKLNRECEFDLILMDLQMPIMSGEEAVSIIRSESNGEAIPILAFTANALEGDYERYVASGMNGVITKPISKHSLLSAINEATKQD